ncbi:MAG: ShlB/FhaC/HecB family hemolysin secretion/activation protein [Patescibacteria group bacterium]|nr:ShlB/FhaC/HecB family hemolysin secretion/activation protein [Patescibacteria group bacterium]
MVGKLVRSHKGALWLLVLAGAAITAAPAQADNRLPSAADAGRLQQDRTPPPVPEAESGTAMTVPVEETVMAPAGAEKLFFVLKDIVIEGAHRYSAEELLAPYARWRGGEIPLSQVYDVASSILRHYHRDGYSFVSVIVPPQQIASGIVHIRVIEGYVSRVTVEGIAETPLVADLERRLMEMRPLHAPALEENLLLLGDLPGIIVKGIVEPDRQSGEEGALVLRLVGQTKSVDASVSVDNYASRYTGPWEVTPMLAANGMLRNYDRTMLSGLSSIPYREAHYYSLSHSEVIDLRDTATITVSRSASAPGFTLAPEDIVSRTTGISVSLRHALLRSRAENWSMTGTFEANNLESDILGTTLYRDRIRAFRLNSSYDTVDRWQGTDLFNLTLSQGLNGLHARQTGDPDLSRAKGRSDFTKLELTASRLQPLPAEFGAYTLVKGQYAPSALLASEEFGYGGPFIGRGYDPSEITGDRGIALSEELRYYGAPAALGIHSQPFAFYDIGKIWNEFAGGEAHSAASAGIGLHAEHEKGISATVFLAWPLTRTPAAPPSTSHPDAPRLGLFLSAQY